MRMPPATVAAVRAPIAALRVAPLLVATRAAGLLTQVEVICMAVAMVVAPVALAAAVAVVVIAAHVVPVTAGRPARETEAIAAAVLIASNLLTFFMEDILLPNQNIQPVQKSHWMRTAALLLFLGFLLAVSGAYWYWSEYIAAGNREEAPLELTELALGGDPARAAAEAERFLREASGSSYAIWASTVHAQAVFDAATTTDGFVEGVRLMKANLMSAETSYQRAIALNAIAAAVVGAQNRDVYAEVFRDPPISELRVATSSRLSTRNLLKYSIAQYPTADAYIDFARQSAEQILATFEPGSSKAISGSQRAKAYRVARASEIVDSIAKADTLIAQELSIEGRYISPYEPAVAPGRDLWAGFALGAAAYVRPDLLPSAERRLSLAVEGALATKDPSGNPYPMLERTAARAHLMHARLLHALAQKERASDIRMHMGEFLKTIQSSPTFYWNFFTYFDDTKAGRSVEADNADSLYREYREYADIAAYVPELASFLKLRGWDL